MDYKLLPAQKEFINIPHNFGLDVAIYQGGYGSGKTFAGSLLGILLCYKYPGIVGLVGAMTFPLVRDTTLKTYFEHFDKWGLIAERDYFYKAGESKIIFANGSEILFRHLEEPFKLKSLNLGFVEIEEMSDTPESTFKMLLSRLRQQPKEEWKDFQYRLFGHTNPEMTKGWIYKHFIQNPKENYRFIQAPTTQNKFLPAHYVEELKASYDPEYYRINVLGEFGDYTSGLVVKNFTKDNIKECKHIDTLDLHLTCDFNVDPMMWCVAHKTEDKVFFIDEIVIENTSTQEAIQEFITRYGNHKGKIIVNGDASGDYRSCQSERSNYIIIKNALEKHFRRHIKIDIKKHNPPIIERIQAFNNMVLNDTGQRNIIVSPKCEKLLYNIDNLKFKPGTSQIDTPTFQQLKQDKQTKFLGHIFDAASYLVDFYFGVKRVNYADN
jgi:PBSX family phage terminase large subunit